MLGPLSAHRDIPDTSMRTVGQIAILKPELHGSLKISLYVKNDLIKISSTRQTLKTCKPSTQNDIPVKLMPTEPVDLLAASRLQLMNLMKTEPRPTMDTESAYLT